MNRLLSFLFVLLAFGAPAAQLGVSYDSVTRRATPTNLNFAVLYVDGSINLTNTTNGARGVINKGGLRFLHDYSDVTSSGFNTFVGAGAGNFTMGPGGGGAFLGSFNTGIGYDVLNDLTTGYQNTGVGYSALSKVTSGTFNTAVGRIAGAAITTGVGNTAVGSEAFPVATIGTYNTALGFGSLNVNTTGDRNTFVGALSGVVLTSGSDNTAVGYQALGSAPISSFNTAIGAAALKGINSGGFNIALGHQALQAMDSGTLNIAIGITTLGLSTNGLRNIAIGTDVMQRSTSGDENTIVGTVAGISNVLGSSNVFLGAYSGITLTNGDGNILIGHRAYTPSNNRSNFLNIGRAIYGDLATGSIGIGTETPADRLEVRRDAAASIGARITNTNVDNASAARLSIVGPTASFAMTIGFFQSNYTGIAGWSNRAVVASSSGADGLTFAVSASPDDFRWNTANSTESMRLDANGYLGIGTNAPAARLHVTAANNVDVFRFGTTNRPSLMTMTTNGVVTINGATGGLIVGDTTAQLTNMLYASATLDFPSTLAQTDSDLPITVTGAAPGDIVSLGSPTIPLTGSTYTAFASNDTVYVRFSVYGLAAKDPASGTFRIRVDKFK